MDQFKKLAFAKGIDIEKKQVTGYVSTFQWDRDMDRFAKGAWDLAAYMKNPVVLWAHNPIEPPIGKAISITEDEHGLLATTQFDDKSDKAMHIFSLFERKFLNAFSVGFIRKAFVMEDAGGNQKGMAITEAELYEYSAVAIPANPGALVSREVAEIAMKTLGPNMIETICTKGMGEQFLVLPVREEEALDAEEEDKTEQPDFEKALISVTELAKIARGTQVTETKRSLITTAVAVFNEILAGHKAEITPEEMEQLGQGLKDFAGAVGNLYPDAAAAIQKTISQIGKAI